MPGDTRRTPGPPIPVRSAPAPAASGAARGLPGMAAPRGALGHAGSRPVQSPRAGLSARGEQRGAMSPERRGAAPRSGNTLFSAGAASSAQPGPHALDPGTSQRQQETATSDSLRSHAVLCRCFRAS
ncbi:collagen alpha-1(III) chain-like [Prinia subflava]|uniref:collagen alpha-1(III) chain-like n=1 Tax=Prinia subflava TaxID=208062 RepID=UPI002FE3AEF9